MKLVLRLQSAGVGSIPNAIERGSKRRLGGNQSAIKRIPCAVGAAISHD